MNDLDLTIGHKHDRSFAELNEAMFEATLSGDEMRIQTLQDEMRLRFGDLF